MSEDNLTLEQIADRLLAGKIDSDTAAKLSENAVPCNDEQETNTSGDRIVLEDGRASIIAQDGFERAYIEFMCETDASGNPYFFLRFAESFEQGQGHHRTLIGAIEREAKRQDIRYLLAENDLHNNRILEINDGLGFYSVGEVDTVSDRTETMLVRKDIR